LIFGPICAQGKLMTARIYQRPKNAMQSGKALLGQWILNSRPQRRVAPIP
jgi:hypothetical protein